MSDTDAERWFEIEFPKPTIRSIIVGKDAHGFKINIHAINPDEHFKYGDTTQDRVSSVIKILHPYLGPESRWLDCETRQPVHVWDALAALSDLEEWP